MSGAMSLFGASGLIKYASGSGSKASPFLLALALNASGSLPIATASTLGGVIVPAAGGLSVDGSGNLTLHVDGATLKVTANQLVGQTGTTSVLGLAKFPAAGGLSLTTGSVSLNVDNSTLKINGSNQLSANPIGRILASVFLTSNVANTTILTYAVTTSGLYRVGGYLKIISIQAGRGASFSVGVTDENGVQRNQVFVAQGKTSGSYSAANNGNVLPMPPMDLYAEAGHNITVVGGANGGFSWDGGAWIERVM